MAARSSVFSSERERRLWLGTAAAATAIYATLGPARTLADALRDRGLLQISLAAATAVLILVLAGSVVRRRPGWSDLGVAIGVAFAYWGMFLRLSTPEERTHLIEYGIVAALIHQALLERERNARHVRDVRAPAALAVVLTAVLGSIDEGIQAVLPSRVFDIRDIFFNALAGFMAVAARLALGPQRGPGWRLWFLWLMSASIGHGMVTYWGWFDGTEPTYLDTIPMDLRAGFLGVAGGALATAMAQSLALRRHGPPARQWTATTFVAVAVSAALALAIGAADRRTGWLAGLGGFGAVAGCIQWTALRKHSERAWWWVPASTVLWAVSLPLGDAAGPMALGAAYGASTGAVLVCVLREEPAPGRQATGRALKRRVRRRPPRRP